jgi:hypothetical protein
MAAEYKEQSNIYEEIIYKNNKGILLILWQG